VQHCPSWEANGYAASQEIPCTLWNLKVHYPVTHLHSEPNDSGQTTLSSPLRLNLKLSYMCTILFSLENKIKWHHFLNGYLCKFPLILFLLTSLWSYYGSNLQYTASHFTKIMLIFQGNMNLAIWRCNLQTQTNDKVADKNKYYCNLSVANSHKEKPTCKWKLSQLSISLPQKSGFHNTWYFYGTKFIDSFFQFY
jgi:hypothetical protein